MLRQLFIRNPEVEQGKPHTLDAQFLLFDLPVAVAFPKTGVVAYIICVEKFKVVDAFAHQLQIEVELLKGCFCIGVKVPEGVVKVEEKMLVFHTAEKKAAKVGGPILLLQKYGIMNAVITGASRGIGKAIAHILAQHGYNLYLCSQNEHTLLQTIEELTTQFPSVSIDGKALDISKKANAELFAEWVHTHTDAVDVLVNNAGTFIQGNVSDEPDGALEQMLNVNLYSAYHTTRALLPKMKAAGTGHIFTVCSIASLSAYPGGGAYSISKFALLGFTKNLRAELKSQGIKVTAIIPGAVYTDSWKGSGVPEERIMEAKDIARIVLAATQVSPQATVEEIVIRPQLGDL